MPIWLAGSTLAGVRRSLASSTPPKRIVTWAGWPTASSRICTLGTATGGLNRSVDRDREERRRLLRCRRADNGRALQHRAGGEGPYVDGARVGGFLRRDRRSAGDDVALLYRVAHLGPHLGEAVARRIQHDDGRRARHEIARRMDEAREASWRRATHDDLGGRGVFRNILRPRGSGDRASERRCVHRPRCTMPRDPPLPLAGRGRGWGSLRASWPADAHPTTPTPSPSPQGERRRPTVGLPHVGLQSISGWSPSHASRRRIGATTAQGLPDTKVIRSRATSSRWAAVKPSIAFFTSAGPYSVSSGQSRQAFGARSWLIIAPEAL